MWANVVETVLKMIAVILPSLFSYQAGKKAVESDMQDTALNQVNASREIDEEINRSHNYPFLRKRLRDECSE